MAKLGSSIIGFVVLVDCLRNRSITDQISFARLNHDVDPLIFG